MSLRTARTGLQPVSFRRLALPPKAAKSIYSTPEFKRWREAVVSRAGRRCERIVDGARCAKAEPRHRMFADHVEELTDGGDPFDLGNGECLCGAHHSAKTAAARAARAGAGGGGGPTSTGSRFGQRG